MSGIKDAELTTLRAENERLREAISWALGETDFRPRKEGEGAYWWRKELRERAALQAGENDA